MLNPSQRAEIKNKILSALEKGEADVIRLVEQTRPISPDNAIGRLSRMEAIQSKSIQEAALRTAQIKLSRLKVALTRVDGEDLGLCRECDDPIPFRRLLAVPENDLCIDCAKAQT